MSDKLNRIYLFTILGLSAYLSLVHLCKARAGETVVISSAAGQIGHLAGQIAKILGLNVIGEEI